MGTFPGNSPRSHAPPGGTRAPSPIPAHPHPAPPHRPTRAPPPPPRPHTRGTPHPGTGWTAMTNPYNRGPVGPKSPNLEMRLRPTSSRLGSGNWGMRSSAGSSSIVDLSLDRVAVHRCHVTRLFPARRSMGCSAPCPPLRREVPGGWRRPPVKRVRLPAAGSPHSPVPGRPGRPGHFRSR